MPQGYLPFKYQEEKNSTHMTALAGLPPYLELAIVAGMADSIKKNLKIRAGEQGWTDTQQVLSLVLLNISGGGCVNDLNILRGDGGLVDFLEEVRTHNMRRREREAMEKRLRQKNSLGVPSPSAAFEYFRVFHDPEEEKKREAHSVMKEDLAGGKLPSGLFGVNAAWWAIMILAFNLNSAMKHLVLGGSWVTKRMKAIRFALINLPGRIIKRSRELIVRLTGGHVSNELLFTIRNRIVCLSKGSYG